MRSDLDPAAEGLLDDVEGEDREQLEGLLKRLHESGAGIEELREAVEGGRLALLAAERALAGGERYSANDIAERVGVEIEVLEAQWRALGMVIGDREEPILSKADLEAAERVRELLDVGLSPEAVEETSRVMAMSLAQVAASHREMVADLVLGDEEPADVVERGIGAEVDAAERLEAVTRALIPLIGPSLEHLYTLQLREQLRHAVIDVEARRDGRSRGVEDTAVAFADLVGFTKLGEELPPEEFGEITLRFSGLASGVAGGPVRLVKMIGDAAMFTATEPEPLAAAVLELIELAEGQEDGFPILRAGLSWGTALSRGGDLYGRAVNLASRLTGAARPGSLLVGGEGIEERLGDGFRLSDAGHKRLKGIDGGVHVYRCRLAAEPGDDEQEQELSPERPKSRRRRARQS